MFQYHGVPVDHPRTIRVLKLHPTYYGDALRCTLKTVSLDDSKEAVYDAVSYVWGTAPSTSSIICNGETLHITPSCETVLRRLRDTVRSRKLWVDSICIDQSNKKEQGVQVKLMKDIYSSARLVLLWTGEGTESSAAALKYVSQIAQIDAARGSYPSAIDDLRRKLLENRVARLKEINLDLSSGSGQTASTILSELFKRPWFHRMWTIQELVLARKAVLICGEYSVPWDAIREALEVITIFAPTLLGTETPWSVNLYNELRDMIKRKRIPRLPDSEPLQQMHDQLSHIAEYRFFRALRSLNRRDSKWPADRIFALYGLFANMGITLPDPDYFKPISETFREATAAIISQQKTLTILILGTGPHTTIPDLPSWAIDWTFSTPGILPHIFPPNDSWRATPGWSAGFRFSADRKQLIVKGTILDTLRASCREFPPAHYLQDMSVRTIYGMRVLENWLLATFLSLKAEFLIRMGRFMTVIMEPSGYVKVGEDGVEYDQDVFADWLAVMLNMNDDYEQEVENIDIAALRQELVNLWPNIPSVDGDEFHRLPELDEAKKLAYLFKNDAVFEFHFKMIDMAMRSSFFVTYYGNMGRCQLPPKAGDVVAIVAGVDFPLLLRKVDEDYVLLGPAYVYSMMRGEVCGEGFEGWDDIVLV